MERCIEIVGEAARRVSTTTQSAHPDIPWRQLVGMRNVLAHEYGNVDHVRVFDTVATDLPTLVAAIDAILPADAAD